MSTHMNDTEFTHALHADAIKHDPFCQKSGCKTPKPGLTSTEYECAFFHTANCGALWKKVELPDGRLELWYASNVPHVRHVTSPTAADWGRSLAQIAEVLASKGIGLDDTQRRALKSKKGRMTGKKTPGLTIESRQRNTFGKLVQIARHYSRAVLISRGVFNEHMVLCR
ncbi:hypothetical protein T492DRAFT_1054028 [Pavlovales sp. CCMP2436]|nr:hypothetical protein T492DRAFT_1054028 [Pavlovales sp. CCMP2436]